jgi:hypothetical protein
MEVKPKLRRTAINALIAKNYEASFPPPFSSSLPLICGRLWRLCTLMLDLHLAPGFLSPLGLSFANQTFADRAFLAQRYLILSLFRVRGAHKPVPPYWYIQLTVNRTWRLQHLATLSKIMLPQLPIWFPLIYSPQKAGCLVSPPIF